MIQEEFRASIESKLNDNTDNKKFIVGSYVYKDNTDEHFVYSVRNGYKLISTDYIFCMMRFVADFKPIPNQINGNANINLQFLIKADTDEQVQEDIATVNQVVSKIVANYENIVDGSTTYKTVWNMSAIIPAGLTERPYNGNYYIIVQTTIYITFSDSIELGNAYTYFLDSIQLKGYDGHLDRNNTESYPHLRGDYEAKGNNEDSAWKATFVVYVDSSIKTIIDSISSETYNMNTIYQYTEKYNGTTLHTFPVRINSISKPVVLGEFLYATITLIKSDKPKPA